VGRELPLLAALSRRVGGEDVSFRTRLLEIAQGLTDVISLGRGDPDFHTPHHIVEAAKAAIDDNQHHYTDPVGLPQLREAISENLLQDYSLDYNVEEIVVTDGVQEAIMLCALALVDEGDEVLLPSPRFTSYDLAIRLCGGKPVPVQTHERNDFALMATEIEMHITDRTKVLVLVTPNNPTGAVTPPSEIRRLAALVLEHDLTVISDEIYAKLIYEGSEHLSIGSLPGMRERTITVNGFSKTYAMTGWRVGYLAAPQPFIRKVIEPRHALSISTCTPSQYAALAALTGPQDEVEKMRQAYAARRMYVMEALDDMGLTYGLPGGAFYIYANISSTNLAAAQFCETLLREGRVMVFPGTMFGDENDNHVRISYLQPIDRIEEALQRMQRVVDEHRVAA
jgi:aminotransferase